MERILNDRNLNIENKIDINEIQERFLESKIFKIVNIGLNYGIRKILPDFIEEHIIDLKDNLINNGIKEGLNKTIKEVLENGKNLIGILKGDFKNINQIKNVMEAGNLIDEISKMIDYSINMIYKKNIVDKNILNKVKDGKDIIINNIEQNIENMFKEQISYVKNLKYNIAEWKKGFEDKDFMKMKKIHKKIMKGYNQIIPFEKLIQEAKMIDNIQKRIQNKNEKIELSEDEISLLKMLN